MQKKLKFLLGVVIIILLALITYFAALPEYIANQYINQVREKGNMLYSGYNKLENSTDNTLVIDPSEGGMPISNEVESLHNLLRENRINLNQFTAVVSEYNPLPYTGFTARATGARALHYKATAFIEQSEETLAKYDELIVFIKRYDATAKVVSQHTEEFNATTDLNVYAGQADRMFSIAEQIRQEIKLFEAIKAPHETDAFKTASVQSFNKIADGFDTVGRGLEIPADETIYEGARQIEEADQTISSLNQEIYSREILSSRTIKSVKELREKLDLIMP